MYKIQYFGCLAITLGLLAGCSANGPDPFSPASAAGTATGAVSQKNFSILADNTNPAVIDGTTGAFTKTDVGLTVYIGDRNNQVLGDAHTIRFKSEYGLVEPSCVTTNGSCSVTWSATAPPISGGAASDGFTTITAYTVGEESFIDSNGNGTYDDTEGFYDLEEPYVDTDLTVGLTPNGGGAYDPNDIIIDVVSTNDPSGINGTHDIADGFFNGTGCTHTSLCAIRTSTTVFDSVVLDIVNSRLFTIGGSVTGIPASTTLVLQNNGGDDLSVTADGNFTFATGIADGTAYTVTVLTNPAGATCTVTSGGSGNVSGSNVTNVVIGCI